MFFLFKYWNILFLLVNICCFKAKYSLNLNSGQDKPSHTSKLNTPTQYQENVAIL